MDEYRTIKKRGIEIDKILILGASGYIGGKLMKQLGHDYECFGTYHQHALECNEDKMFYLDLKSYEALEGHLKEINPKWIISALRGDFKEQFDLHSRLAKTLSKQKECRLIFISTANVFDGEDNKPHYERDELKAKSTYGQYKLECEQMLKETLGEQCIILRIPMVWDKGCPRVQLLQTESKVPAWKNLWINITTVQQMADYILWMMETDQKGIFHVGTSDTYEYTALLQAIGRKLEIQLPKLEIEIFEEPVYQVLLTEKTGLPKKLTCTVEDVLNSL